MEKQIEENGSVDNLELSDILDIEKVHNLMNAFHELTDIGVALLDVQGKILVAIGWRDICTKFHRVHPETLKNCHESDIKLSSGVALGTYKIYKCKNNMIDVVTPIVVEGKHLGNLYQGQFVSDENPKDNEIFRKQAKKYGFNEEDYLRAYSLVPHWNDEKIKLVMSFYMKLAGMISELSYNNIKLTKTLSEKKKTEVLLQQTRQNYETFFNTIDEFLFVLDENGNIIHTNSTVLERLGYLAEEVKGLSVLMMHPAHRREEAGQLVGEMLAGRTKVCPIPIITKDGKEIPVETRISCGVWDGKPAIFGVTKDISKLKSSEEKFAKIFHLNPCACGLSDLQTGQYTEVNEQFYTLFGFNKNEVIGKSASELGILSVEARSSILQRADYSGKVTNVEANLKTKNGEVKHVLLSADNISVQNKIYRFTVVNDITERKRTEEELHKSAELYRVLFDMSSEALMTLEPPEWKFTSANPVTVKMFTAGDENNFISRAPWEFSPEYQQDGSLSMQKAKEMIEDAMLNGQRLFEWTHKRLSGEDFFATVLLTRMEIKGQQFLQASVRDVSEHKKIIKEKAEMQAQIIHSSKLASIGTLAAGVAHEVNNPLTIVMGNIDIQKEKCKKRCEGFCIDQMEKATIACQRIANIVNGLRNFARADTEIIELIDIHKAIQDTQSLVSNMFSKENVEIELDLRAITPEIMINMGKLQQVIMNMLTNARDAIKEVHNSGIVKISTSDTENMINIVISDNGIGINENQKAQVFDPFFTTKGPNKGTGLGLSISHSIITNFGGSISLESERNIGSAFTITLPRDFNKSYKKSEENPFIETDKFKFKGSRVLIVDDEEEIRNILVIYLSELGCKIHEARNGKEALAELKNEKYDYVFLDLKMPDMNGDAVLLESEKIPNIGNTKFIVVTGGIITEYSKEMRTVIRCKAAAYIKKPFSLATIIDALISAMMGK